MPFDSLRSKIDYQYASISNFTNDILKTVIEKVEFQGLYNPKYHILIESEDDNQFLEFQAFMRGLTNFFYYNSLILTIYSSFEFSIKQVCQFIYKRYYPEITFNENNTKDVIGYCNKYISSTVLLGKSNKQINKLWEEITQVQKLRNLLAHQNGNLVKHKKVASEHPYFKLFSKDKRLFIAANGQVYIDDDEYIRSFLKNTQVYLFKVIELEKQKQLDRNL